MKNRRVHPQDFGAEGTRNSRESMVKELNLLLIEERFHFCSIDLRAQLTNYNPTERNKGENKKKGDLADAGIQGVHRLLKQTTRNRQTSYAV